MLIRKLGVALLAVGLCAAAWADDLTEVEKKMVAASEKVKSYSADMTLQGEMKNGPMNMVTSGGGVVKFMRDGELMKTRMELKQNTTMKVGDDENKIESSMLSISDGKFTWTLSEQAGTKQAVKSTLDPESAGVTTKAMIDSMHEKYEVKLQPEQKVEGADCYVIDLTPKEQGGMVGKMVNYITKDTGLMVKMEILTTEGQTVQTVILKNIKLNEAIKAEEFEFKAPEGVKVLDRTQDEKKAPAAAPAGDKKDDKPEEKPVEKKNP